MRELLGFVWEFGVDERGRKSFGGDKNIREN